MIETESEVGVSPLTLAAVAPGRMLAGVGLLGTTVRSYFLTTASTWRSLLWPSDAPLYHVEHVDSSDLKFTPSGEQFPIDLIGSYDVDRAKEIIEKAPRRSKPVQVAFWREYADRMEWPRSPTDPNIDYSFPAIVATIDKVRGRYLLIDGWHRIDNASAEGRESIEGFYLTEEETKEIFNVTWAGLPKGPPAVPAFLPRVTISAQRPCPKTTKAN